MKLPISMVALFAVIASALPAWAQYPSLANVHSIYIDRMGNNDDAERFRSLAAQELERAGFSPASSPEGADAILKGTFTFANYGEKSGGSANVRLVSRDDKEIWAGSVSDKIRPGQDSTRWVAQKLAETLKKQKERESRAEKKK